MKEIFQRIYDTHAWGAGSGPGANPAACRPYLDWLQQYIRDTQPASVLDVGCGDMRLWQGFDWSGADYLGVDLVDCHHAAALRFWQGDALHLEWDFDLVIVKDVLQHLPHAVIEKFFDKFGAAGAVIVTNDATTRNDGDIDPGEYRAVDLTLPPYNRVPLVWFTFDSVPRRKLTALFSGKALSEPCT